MLTVLSSLTSFFKLKTTCVDNNIFRLHYKATVVVLICSSILVSAYQFFGQPIECLQGRGPVSQQALDTFCWVNSTFSVVEGFRKKVGDVAYPGVEDDKRKEVVYHRYYQWVCIVLFLQALLFFFPHYLWKIWEGGKIKAIIQELDQAILTDEVKEEKTNSLLKYLKKNRGYHTKYAAYFVVCEILNLVNVVGQLFLMDKFLDYKFLTYGSNIAKYNNLHTYDNNAIVDPMLVVFPKITRCQFHYYGSGSGVQHEDVMCLLPLNIINEKIYAFLWFWFNILITATAAMLVYRFVVLLSRKVRYFSISFKCSSIDGHDLLSVLRFCNYGDWFLLNLLAKNLETNNYKDVIERLAKEFQDDDKEKLLAKLESGETGKKLKGFM